MGMVPTTTTIHPSLVRHRHIWRSRFHKKAKRFHHLAPNPEDPSGGIQVVEKWWKNVGKKSCDHHGFFVKNGCISNRIATFQILPHFPLDHNYGRKNKNFTFLANNFGEWSEIHLKLHSLKLTASLPPEK